MATPAGQSEPGGFRLFSDYNFHVSALTFVTNDRRFTWDTDVGGDLDLVAYGPVRLNFLTNYEVILGEERLPFEANQSNNTFNVRTMARFGPHEVGFVFHHVSRHRIDRAKPFRVDWNMLGLEFSRGASIGRLHLTSALRALRATKVSAGVHYLGKFDGEVFTRYRLTDRWALVTAGGVTVLVKDRAVFQRRTEIGGYAEGGVRLNGSRGALELFVAAERRLDADLIEQRAYTWALVGFRVVNKD